MPGTEVPRANSRSAPLVPILLTDTVTRPDVTALEEVSATMPMELALVSPASTELTASTRLPSFKQALFLSSAKLCEVSTSPRVVHKIIAQDAHVSMSSWVMVFLLSL